MFLHRLGEPCGPIHPDTRNDNRMGECDNVCLHLGALLWPLELSLSPIFLNLCYGIASNPVSEGRNSDRTHMAGPQDEGPSHSSERPPPHLEPQSLVTRSGTFNATTSLEAQDQRAGVSKELWGGISISGDCTREGVAAAYGEAPGTVFFVCLSHKPSLA